MNQQNTSFNMWSPEANTEHALKEFVDNLFNLARQCAKEPSEASALRVCETTRYLSDTVEGMLIDNISIDPDLLSRAIDGIATSVETVQRMPSLPSLKAAEHVEKMLKAMLGRKEDLLALKEQGKLAFLQRA